LRAQFKIRFFVSTAEWLFAASLGIHIAAKAFAIAAEVARGKLSAISVGVRARGIRCRFWKRVVAKVFGSSGKQDAP